MRLLSLGLGALLVFGLPEAAASAQARQSAASSSPKGKADELAPLRALLQTPENKIDFARAKLTIDRMIDPRVDEAATLKQLNALAARIKARFPVGASNQTKLELLILSMSQPGPWNEYRPFSYDLNDPFGKNIHNKLISTYLASRKGNCVSMPILLAILGQKMGLNITLATAPEHVFAKFRSDSGQWINIEATSFGTKRDVSYQQEMAISPKAISNNIYLRPLSRHEAVAVMAGTLLESYGRQGQQERRIAVADLLLQVDPKDTFAMLQKGNAYFKMVSERYLSKYKSFEQLPADQRKDFERLKQGNSLWFDRAEALGWALPAKTNNARYLEHIQRTKTAKDGAEQ